jgi:hypothetical protein
VSANWEPKYGDVVRPKGGVARLILLWPNHKIDVLGSDFGWYAMAIGPSAGYGSHGSIRRIKHVGDNVVQGWRLA